MTQKKLNRGELVCLIPSGSDPFTDATIGMVMRDWCYWTHGDYIEIKWLNEDHCYGDAHTDPHYIQTLDEYGQHAF